MLMNVRIAVLLLLTAPMPAVAAAGQKAGKNAEQAWIKKSNSYTQKLLDIEAHFEPEQASEQGLAKYDTFIADPSLAAEKAERKDSEAVVAKLVEALKKETDPNVVEDLNILIRTKQLDFKREEYEMNHDVPFLNATAIVYRGLAPLLDDQLPQSRRIHANERMQRYAGLDPDPAGNQIVDVANMSRNAASSAGLGNKMTFDESLVAKLEKRLTDQMAKPGMEYPSREEIESQLARNASMVNGLEALFYKYKIANWQGPFAALQRQLVAYDDFVKKYVLPRARTDFRIAPELYALDMQGYGIDIPPDQLATMAHKAFTEYQAQMAPLAAEIAKEHGWSSTDYRDVIRELKKQQLVGDSILPFYEKRLGEIEKIIVAQKLVTLPTRPAIIRLGTPAESAQQPAPHMVPPPFLHNTGERGVFVLPLTAPAGAGEAKQAKMDDFTYDTASWSLISHEARPGHELQFDSMVEHGVSEARVLYAFNSTNVEGWGLYSEYIMLPYMPKEGQLISLQGRLLRAARAFLDPELQEGKIQPDEAMKVLTKDVVYSEPFANSEVERYTFRAPGQATSYFYGFTRLLQLRKETEDALGPKFDALRFHDFILAQGLLPPDLMKKAVEDNFIPAEKAK